MSVKVIYNPDGDLYKEDELRDYALTQRFVLRDSMKFHDLKQDQRHVELVGGGNIHVTSCYGEDIVRIYAPINYLEEKWGLSKALVASSCHLDNDLDIDYAGFSVWNPWTNEKADVGFTTPCQYFGNSDVGTWYAKHMSWIPVSGYSVDESENTITHSTMDFTAFYGDADISMRPGYFARVPGNDRNLTRVVGVSQHTLKFGNVRAFYVDGAYRTFDLGYCVRMFTTSGLAMNGCGVAQPPTEYSNSQWCSDAIQIQSYVGLWATTFGIQQSRLINNSEAGFYTSYTYDENSAFKAYLDELIEWSRAHSGWDREGVINTYVVSGLYRYDKNIDS